ncbi:MAG: amidohydrolase [Nocardioidaceae bacterium]|nr:amidohydrolase [Nocardioidaceae bacterium]
MELIDARVRLPEELRVRVRGSSPELLHEQYDRVLDLTAKTAAGTLDALLNGLDDAGIARAVLHAEYEDDADATQLNDAVAALVAKFPERFRGVGTIDLPLSSPTAAARQVDQIAALGLVGVNVQPAFFDLDIDDRRLYPVYSRAEELGLVVALHTGINYSRMSPIRHERAELLDQVACDFPGLRLVACHAGWPWVTEFCAVARRHPTVYLEFGGLAPRYVGQPGTGWDVLFTYLPKLLTGQVLFGTDWPVMPFGRVLEEWRALDLGDDVLERLLGGNARALFWGESR